MQTIVIVQLIYEILRLVNNIIEAKPMEQRRAEAALAWRIARPLIMPLLPEESRRELAAVEKEIQ